jgi:hypothetical protein
LGDGASTERGDFGVDAPDAGPHRDTPDAGSHRDTKEELAAAGQRAAVNVGGP